MSNWIEEALVDEESLYNDLARFFHLKRHKSDRTYFCASDRTLAEELVSHFIEDRRWVVVEDVRDAGHENNRSS